MGDATPWRAARRDAGADRRERGCGGRTVDGRTRGRPSSAELEDPAVEAPVDYAISGVALFDAVKLKRHLVFLDEDGGCLRSTTSTVTVEPGETLRLAALFPAPPDDVDAMTVQTPIGAVSDVPLADE